MSLIQANQSRLIDSIDDTSEALEKHAERSTEAIESLVNKLAAAKAPQWGALAAWAAVILTVVGLLLNSYGGDQSRLEKLVQDNDTKFLKMKDESHDQNQKLFDRIADLKTDLAAVKAEVKTKDDIIRELLARRSLDK